MQLKNQLIKLIPSQIYCSSFEILFSVFSFFSRFINFHFSCSVLNIFQFNFVSLFQSKRIVFFLFWIVDSVPMMIVVNFWFAQQNIYECVKRSVCECNERNFFNEFRWNAWAVRVTYNVMDFKFYFLTISTWSKLDSISSFS